MRKRSSSSWVGIRFQSAARFGTGWLFGVLLGYVFMESLAWYRTPPIGEVANELNSLAAGSNYWIQAGPDAAVWRERLGTPTMIETVALFNGICWSYNPPYPWDGDIVDRLGFRDTVLSFCFTRDTDRVNLTNRGEPFPSQERQ